MKKICKTIGTHDGKFHCDEVLACFMLKILPEFSKASIIRTRDENILKECDIVVDVGGVYDVQKLRFDHHQKTFYETLNSIIPKANKFDKIKLSSAGLIYAHYGSNVIGEICKNMSTNTVLDDSFIDYMYFNLYENFVQEVDAIDNGIEMVEADIPKKYHITTNLSSRVGYLNPAWNDKLTQPNDQFYKAMELVGVEFVDRIQNYVNVIWPIIEIVQKAINNRNLLDKSGEIISMDVVGPWKSILYDIEKSQNIMPTIKYVIYPTLVDQTVDTLNKGPGNGNADHNNKDPSSVVKDWRVQCVSIEKNSFLNRRSLPKSWQGLRNEELSEISGIDGCIFVHMSGFIGGNKTFEGALQMARKSLTSV